MDSPTTILTAGLTIGYAILLIILLGHDREWQGVGTRRWMILTLLAAMAGTATFLLPENAHTSATYADYFPGDLTQPALTVIAINLMLVFFGHQTLRYLQFRSAVTFSITGLVWWIGQVMICMVEADSVMGQEGWLGSVVDPLDAPGVLVVGGWLVIGAWLLTAAFYAFYRARLPEVANRALVWAIVILLVLLGAVLSASGSEMLVEIGWGTQFIGLAGAAYSLAVYHVVDIRRMLRRTTATGILTAVTALVVFAALVVAYRYETGTDTDSGSVYVILALLAIAVALVYMPLRTAAQHIADRLIGMSGERSAQVLRQFSEDITGVVELDALVDVTMYTLSQVLRVRRGGLILVTKAASDAVAIRPAAHGMGEMPDIKGRIALKSPVYSQLARRRAPMLQYDLDYGRVYADVPAQERRFFQLMRMSAYAPVVVQGDLIGILCCGAKATDDPFTDQELELLMTIANQAGVALRNARLVSDLRRRESELTDLNVTLSSTTEQLERLDNVKTDFITIASHELRTPLAQIRGYTDIMEAMNEEGMLDQDQIAGMTGNLRKAADRLEDLIGAMLDMSQIDVNAMDLSFAQTSLENVMRMAIEPLTEAIHNRKLMLSARGLRQLPPIQADMQRLVQAFRNVVLNAIKFTPDGGRIDISGRLVDDEVIIMIKDTGIGIDPANHDLIFKKFFRAHDPNLHSTGTTKFMGAGPGLGLTITMGVIEGHGGRLWVESPGHDPETLPGSTFFIALPLNPPSDARRVKPFAPSTAQEFDLTADAVRPPGTAQRDDSARDSAASGQTAASAPTLMRPPEGLRELLEQRQADGDDG